MTLTTEDLQAIRTLLQPLNDNICILQQDMNGVKKDVAGLKTDVAALKTDVAALKTDVSGLKKSVQQLELRMDRFESRMGQLESRMDQFEARMDQLENRMNRLENRMDSSEKQLHKINLHLESETDPGIHLVAENHLDLMRKLNEAISVADKSRAYEVKVNYLLGEVKSLRTDVDILKERTKTA